MSDATLAQQQLLNALQVLQAQTTNATTASQDIPDDILMATPLPAFGSASAGPGSGGGSGTGGDPMFTSDPWAKYPTAENKESIERDQKSPRIHGGKGYPPSLPPPLQRVNTQLDKAPVLHGDLQAALGTFGATMQSAIASSSTQLNSLLTDSLNAGLESVQKNLADRLSVQEAETKRAHQRIDEHAGRLDALEALPGL
eukprot:11600176-Karenia_brevis.AAC.1